MMLSLLPKARPDTSVVEPPTSHAEWAAPSTRARRAVAEVTEAATQRARPMVTRSVATSSRVLLRLRRASRLRRKAPCADGA